MTDIDLNQQALDMYNFLNDTGPHTFRDGMLVINLESFSYRESMFSIDQATAFYNDEEVPLDLPLCFINHTYSSDIVSECYQKISDLVRSVF